MEYNARRVWDETKIMIIEKEVEQEEEMTIEFNNTKIEQVNRFKYLGVYITSNWTEEGEIKRLLTKTFMKKKIQLHINM